MNAPETAIAVAALRVSDITPSLSNPRKHFDPAYLADLAESIKSHGVIQPITVRPLSLDGLFAYNQRAHPDDERPTYEIVADEMKMLGSRPAGGENAPASRPAPAAAPAAAAGGGQGGFNDFEDDIPFAPIGRRLALVI